MSPLGQKRVLFVQPFGIGSNGGGSRILTSMVKGQSFDKRSINCGLHAGVTLDWIEERHLPVRPSLGRIDRTRFAWLSHYVEIATRASFERKLANEINEWAPDVVHVIPHWSLDFIAAWRIAQARGCRVVMSVHDDLRYTLAEKHPYREKALQALEEMWPKVDHVFSISQELGDEYCSRYGKRSYEIITDGLENIPDHPVRLTANRLTVYFMGLFHYNYRENLGTLTRALARLKSDRPELQIDLVMRCEHLEKGIDSAFPAQVLPFADQDTVLNDMADADLLYMPLPFGKQYEAFTRYSLSTKMVSYLAGGAPILFHGPSDSTSGRLLADHQAALACHSLSDSEMLDVLKSSTDANIRLETVENALKLARTSFPLDVLRRRFLNGLFPGQDL